jgi:hypothetical protein
MTIGPGADDQDRGYVGALGHCGSRSLHVAHDLIGEPVFTEPMRWAQKKGALLRVPWGSRLGPGARALFRPFRPGREGEL